MKTARCPSCGAPVEFRSAASAYAVCGYCHSTLVRKGEELANLGRMADLMDDPTLLQIGSEGKVGSQHFAVIGRIQLKHESGLWNEWHVLFDDGTSAWLSEAGGEFVISRLIQVPEAIPAFETLTPDMRLDLAGHPFVVSDLESALCIAGEGELPFKVDSGYAVNSADLRSGDKFATLDYSETPPLVFVGKPMPFAQLHLANLREKRGAAAGGVPNIEAQAFQCPSCGAPIQLHSGAIETVACMGCGTILDIQNEQLKVIQEAKAATRIEPRLALGSKGKFPGAPNVAWEIIGYLKRSTRIEGVNYVWDEYLLFQQEAGFAWLIEDQGHWNFARPMSTVPNFHRDQLKFRWENQQFVLFNRGRASVDYVLGEFTWRVRVGENVATADYVAGSVMLSRETSKKETTWTRADYVEPETVWSAFGLSTTPPDREGVYPNQPNPWQAAHKRTFRLFWFLILLASAIQGGLMLRSSSSTLLSQTLVYTPGIEEPVASEVFYLREPARTLTLSRRTSLENNWLSLTTTLVDKDSGRTWQAGQEMSYYHGVDGGESWSEGSNSDEIVFRNIPAGSYYLSVEPELGSDRTDPVGDGLMLRKDVLGWSSYVLFLVFILLFPLFSGWRKSAFETSRWEEKSIGDDRPEKDKTEQSDQTAEPVGKLGEAYALAMAKTEEDEEKKTGSSLVYKLFVAIVIIVVLLDLFFS